jgi:D-glycero-D-manno-heptose 1,7-bisphosphate phosphatase
MVRNRAVFLDRDGVINEPIVKDGKPGSPLFVSEIKICPGVSEGISKLREHGFELVVVSNQPEVSRGNLTLKTLQAINLEIARMTGIEHFYCCTHSDDDACVCRKPLPGMILSASADLSLDVQSSFLIGDRWKDILAGLNAGCKTIWIDREYKEVMPENYTYRVVNFLAAVHLVCLDAKKELVSDLKTSDN